MKKRPILQNQKGFTLIELISVMIIMGVMSSVAVKKVDFVTDTASTRALAITVKELNVRESLVWSNMKISNDGYTSDEDVFAALDKDLGAKFKWNPGLQLMVERFTVNRNPLFLIKPTLQTQLQVNGSRALSRLQSK